VLGRPGKDETVLMTDTNNARLANLFRKALRTDLFRISRSEVLKSIRIGNGIRLALASAFLIAIPSTASAQAEPAAATASVGSAFEAAQTATGGDAEFKALFLSWKKMDQAPAIPGQVEPTAISIPSAEPVHGTAFTSGYGVRTDPFRGRAAMHAGIDLAGPLGTPIYATADGVVDRAEWNNGGYGNLVEVNHGHGIQTRYGHLTRYVVSTGEHVKRGQLIAYMGSTGRSTGSHLHYEVRIDGQAVNPVPYLQSTAYLASVQRRASAMAIGGPVAGSN
jgi:murein DD-endopeptidase MepM/ murein hydrolase activator NlpD